MYTLYLLLISWGIHGGVGFNATPQAVTDSTSQVAISPYFKLKISGSQGFYIEGSWRGLFQDTLRHSRSSSRFLTGYIGYESPDFPISFRIGRQFSYLGNGGLVDGVVGKARYRKWKLEILGGIRAPSFFSKEEKFFSDEEPKVFGVQISSPSFYKILRFRAGYSREFKENEVLNSPLWLSTTIHRKLTLRGEIYYDIESNILTRASLIHFGSTPLLSWSLGYRYYDPWEIFKILGVEEEEEEEEATEISKPIHRLEGSIGIRKLPLNVSLGGWVSIPEEESYSNFWVRFHLRFITLYGWIGKEEDGWQRGGEVTLNCYVKRMTFYLVGRLIDEPRWENVWVESLRFGSRCRLPFGGSISGEIRLWSNPEVDREIQGYLGIFLPFEWRSQG
jgi:hypothetical protein